MFEVWKGSKYYVSLREPASLAGSPGLEFLGDLNCKVSYNPYRASVWFANLALSHF